MPKPFVYLDCRQLNDSGIGSYISNLVYNFSSMAPEYPIQLLVGKKNIDAAKKISDFSVKSYNAPIYSVREQFRWIMKVAPGGLLHIPHYNAPLFYPGSLAVTVHDVCHKAMSQFFLGRLRKIYSGPFMKTVLNRAAQIVTVSNFSKSEIIKYYQIASDKIRVIHNGLDEIHRPVSRTESAPIIHKRRLPQDFLLFVGNVKPHKNILGLISSYKLALLESPDLPPLVILGDNRNMIESLPELKSFMTDKTLENKLIFTGYLPKRELPAIYSHSLLFLFPSLYEGFGLPILEAMACGAPVVASNRASIPEVAGEAALLIDPRDQSKMAESIIKMAQDNELRQKYIDKGFKQIKKFSWRKSAEEHLKLYNSIIKQKTRLSRKMKSLPLPKGQKVNILFMDQYGDRIGGGQIILLDILEKLRADNLWNIHVSLPGEGRFAQKLKEKNFSYDCVPYSFPARKNTLAEPLEYIVDSIKIVGRLAPKIKEHDIDVIYCNGGKTFLSAVILSTLFSVKTFFHLHLALGKRARSITSILGRSPKVKNIIAVSETVKNQYKQRKLRSKIEIVSNWVSPELFNAPLKKRDKNLTFPVKIGIIGQISRAKGQWKVIDSLERLGFQSLPVSLRVFGEPLSSEKKQWESLLQKISSLNKKGWDIQYLGFQDNIKKIYDELDFIIVPSLVAEGFGLTAIEAMAAEVVVIAARSGALIEIIKHKENGFLYDTENPDQLTGLLKEIINNKYDIELIRKTGLKIAKKYYNPETQLNKLSQILINRVFKN